MPPEIYAAKQIAIVTTFIVCMYFGFKHGSGWAFAGAVIAFLMLF
jgi:hypothetical protein